MPSALQHRRIFAPLGYRGDEATVKVVPYSVDRWVGYCPDVKQDLLGWAAGYSSRFVARGEILYPDRGYTRIHDYCFGEETAGDDAGEGPLDDADLPQKICYMDNFVKETQTDLLIITRANVGDYSHIFLRDGITGAWAEVEPRGGWSAGPSLTDAQAPFSAGESVVFDGCTFSPGHPDTPPFYSLQECYIICSGTHREVAFLPLDLTNNSTIDPTLNYDYGIDNSVVATNPNSFKAYSVCQFDGRACYWYTIEDGIGNPRRLRHSIVGNPLDITGTGSGFIDADDLTGDGTCIRVIGDSMFAFTTGGSAMFHKSPANEELAPFEIETLSLTRGLWGPRCMITWAPGLAFGIFTDGWFFLDGTGNFQPVGQAPLGNGAMTRRWQDTFYSIVNYAALDRILVVPDQFDSVIRIYFPTAGATEPNVCWVYDTLGDRIFPDEDYDVSSGFPTAAANTPSFSIFNTIGSLGPIGGLGTIGAMSALVGHYSTTFGTSTGHIFEMNRTDVRRQNSDAEFFEPRCRYSSNYYHFDAPLAFKTSERLTVEYTYAGEDPVNALLYLILSDEAFNIGTTVQLEPSNIVPKAVALHPDAISRRFAMAFFSTGNVRLHAIYHEFHVLAGDLEIIP